MNYLTSSCLNFHRLHRWHHPSLQDWMDHWMDHSWSSPPNSSEAMGISTYSSRYPMNSDIWISYEYHMNIIWISYEYHMNIIWISLSLVSLSLIHQMFNPFHDTWTLPRGSQVCGSQPAWLWGVGYDQYCVRGTRELSASLSQPLEDAEIAGREDCWEFFADFSDNFFTFYFLNILDIILTSTIGTKSLVFKVQNLITEEAMTAMILFDHFVAKECQLEGLAHHSWQYGGGGLRGHRAWMFLPGPTDQVFNLLCPRFL